LALPAAHLYKKKEGKIQGPIKMKIAYMVIALMAMSAPAASMAISAEFLKPLDGDQFDLGESFQARYLIGVESETGDNSTGTIFYELYLDGAPSGNIMNSRNTPPLRPGMHTATLMVYDDIYAKTPSTTASVVFEIIAREPVPLPEQAVAPSEPISRFDSKDNRGLK